MVMQKGLKRQWSFSGLATMVRITLIYYVDLCSLFNNPEKDWEIVLAKASETPSEQTLFGRGGLCLDWHAGHCLESIGYRSFYTISVFIGQQ
ncbi:MAG: hypothetical protein MJZ78_03385 [Bacteroidales bacterium]|nr:hypothetical protein [Bacteroidales bacterium]